MVPIHHPSSPAQGQERSVAIAQYRRMRPVARNKFGAFGTAIFGDLSVITACADLLRRENGEVQARLLVREIPLLFVRHVLVRIG